jgi:hypothetical protein
MAYRIALLAGFLVVGCSSAPLTGPRVDAGRDQSVAGDRPADRPVDASRVVGAVCLPLDLAKCPITDAGLPGFSCEPTWSAVLAHTVCVNEFLGVEWRGDCGPYHVRRVNIEVDVADITYYYDIASGMLVAVYYGTFSFGAYTGPCSGPPEGIPPECLNLTLPPLCAADGAIIDRGSPDGGTRG